MGPEFAKLARLVAEAKANMPQLTRFLGINPELQETAQLLTHNTQGQALGPTLTPQQYDRLNAAIPILRRKSLSDLTSPQLQNVHTSGKTGSAAGVKRSIDIRSQTEPALFGGNPTYGALVDDTKSALGNGLELDYPSIGGTIIKPDTSTVQYGRYGFVPKDKSKLTFTLGDSLDPAWSRPHGSAANPADYVGSHYDDNAMGDLVKHYLKLRDEHIDRMIRENPGLKDSKSYLSPNWRELSVDYGLPYDEQRRLRELLNNDLMSGTSSKALQALGLRGIPGHYKDGVETLPRLLPRRFGDIGPPLSPMEDKQLGNLNSTLANKGYGYFEVQGHGLEPSDIDHVVDYGIHPSMATEKKLKKLGIGYDPVVPADSQLNQLDAAKNLPFGDFVNKARDLGLDDIARQMESWKAGREVPKINQSYARGGKVGALTQCSCGGK
jgi:hypothetical protein